MRAIELATLRLLVCGALAAALGPLAGCGSGRSSSGDGNLTLFLADAPDPSASAVHVTIERAEVNVDGSWQQINPQPMTFNLLELAQNEAVLGSIVLPPGHYTQLRLFTSNVTITDDLGTHPVTVPSGDQTGIKVDIDCDVAPNQVCGVLLDFNVAKSIVQLGNGGYHLQPVIPATVKVLSGTVTGTVVDRKGKPEAGATVMAFDSTMTEVNSSVTLRDGTFKIWCLVPDTYTLRVSPRKGTGMTKPGVVVTANRNTDVGTLNLP